MTAEATDALAVALEAVNGALRGYAVRVEHELAARGYEIVRSRTPRGDLRITGYPCTCTTRKGCLEHPFGPVREVSP